MEEIIVINGVEYKKATPPDETPYVLIRTCNAGVHAGYLVSKEGREVTLKHSRRIWYWEGAASLSQLAMEGVSKPDKCKFTMPINTITLFETIEIIPVTDVAKKIIEDVKAWKA